MVSTEDLSLAAIMLILLCEAMLLAFLYFIGSFYKQKFNQSTYHYVFIVSAALVMALLGCAVLGVYPYPAVTIANGLTLAVMAIFGLNLHRTMTRVTK